MSSDALKAINLTPVIVLGLILSITQSWLFVVPTVAVAAVIVYFFQRAKLGREED